MCRIHSSEDVGLEALGRQRLKNSTQTWVNDERAPQTQCQERCPSVEFSVALPACLCARVWQTLANSQLLRPGLALAPARSPFAYCPEIARGRDLEDSACKIPGQTVRRLKGLPLTHWPSAATLARRCSESSARGRMQTPQPWTECLHISALILTLRDPPRPGPAHPREHGDSSAPKSLDPKQ